MELRDYQETAIHFITDLFRKGHKSILYVLPTGGGKTRVFCEVLKKAKRRRKRCCVLVHRTCLLEQAKNHLKALGVKDVPVMTVQSYEGWEKKYDFIVFDEGHHATADTWKKIAKVNGDAQILGVTATPWRMDDGPLGNIFQAAVEGPAISDLIAQGHLVKPTVWVPPEDKPADDPIRLYKQKANGMRTLAFCSNVKQSKELAAKFNDAGIPATWMSGSTSRKQREEAFTSFISGSLKVITSCDVISEGLDVPVTDCVMLLRKTGSDAMYLQQVGRALRPHEKKKGALVLDLVGNTKTHKDPLEKREWSLKFGPDSDREEDDMHVVTEEHDWKKRWNNTRRQEDLDSTKRLVKLKHSAAVVKALKIAGTQRKYGYQWAKMLSLSVKRKEHLDYWLSEEGKRDLDPEMTTEGVRETYRQEKKRLKGIVPLHREVI